MQVLSDYPGGTMLVRSRLGMNHRHERCPLFAADCEAMRFEMLDHAVHAEIRIRVSPTEEKIKKFDIHTARFFNEETTAWLEHALDFVDHIAPFRDVVQDAKDDDHIFACICKLAQVRCVLDEKSELGITLASLLNLLLHHVDTYVAARGLSIDERGTIAVATTNFKNILVFDVQAQPPK